MSSDPSLETRLLALREAIVAPREDDGRPAELTALMPCEPVVGEVVVACWRDSAGGELVELVRIDDGSRLDDPAALREALALLAMVETVEELASFDVVDEVREQLTAWTSELLAPSERFERARTAALAALEAVGALAPDAVRVARTQHLDALGAALRTLETAWGGLEQAAEAWSDALLERRGQEDAAANQDVQRLWRLLGEVRRGPLARPVATALHEGREAGVAMAAAIAAAR